MLVPTVPRFQGQGRGPWTVQSREGTILPTSSVPYSWASPLGAVSPPGRDLQTEQEGVSCQSKSPVPHKSALQILFSLGHVWWCPGITPGGLYGGAWDRSGIHPPYTRQGPNSCFVFFFSLRAEGRARALPGPIPVTCPSQAHSRGRAEQKKRQLPEQKCLSTRWGAQRSLWRGCRFALGRECSRWQGQV